MTNQIRTYDDLLKHRSEMDLLLKAQKELLVADLKVIQAELKAPRETISLVSKMISRKKTNPIVNTAVNQLVDLLLGKLLLKRSGWLTRTAVSMLARNFTSNYVQDHKKQFMGKLFSWIGHRNGNGKSAPGTFPQAKPKK
jgi:hypothetical protein